MMNHLVLGQALTGTPVHGWGDSARRPAWRAVPRATSPGWLTRLMAALAGCASRNRNR